jgi:cytochrome c oxidase assembly factor CtaG
VIPPLLHGVEGAEEALPRFTFGRIFTEWELVSVGTLLVVLTAGLYLWGVIRLRRRGDRWPIGRTLSFVVAGMGSALLATASGLGVYDDTLLSVHMAQHMLLTMVVPLAMALGAPVTLALRTLHRRPRRWLLVVLHSRVAKVLTFPPLTFVLFVTAPWALYFSGWYTATLHHDYLHEMTHLHMVLVGCLFFWPLVGIDPVPGRVPYPFRVLLLALTLPFHAFLGVTIMQQKDLFGGTWYPALHDGPMGAWLPSPAVDQQLAGGILWAAGDAVGLLFFGVLFVQWVRSSMREAEREDRRLDLLEARQARAARAEAPAAPAAPPAPAAPAAPAAPVGGTGAGPDGR